MPSYDGVDRVLDLSILAIGDPSEDTHTAPTRLAADPTSRSGRLKATSWPHTRHAPA